MAPSPFGHETRLRVIEEYFAEAGVLTTDDAWQHVYRLLLWIDPTNGLVHAYESDKCQPGKHWYQRALRVTAQVSKDLGVPQATLRQALDVLFRACLSELERHEGSKKAKAALADEMEADDPDPTGLVAIVGRLLPEGHDGLAPKIAEAARKYLSVENKRKNILGEGFEDVLGVLLGRVAHVPQDRMKLRARLSELPGFRTPSSKRKEKRPDISIFEEGARTELLISTKWSVRADREDQFADEYLFYRDHLVQARPPETVLVTNEFDRARLISAVESPRFRFDRVVHVRPELLEVAYGNDLGDLSAIIRQRKLISLADFLREMTSRFAGSAVAAARS